MLTEAVSVHLVGAILADQLVPAVLDLALLESFRSQRCHGLLKHSIRDGLPFTSIAIVDEKCEDRVTVGKGRLDDVFELDEELVASIERLEGVTPVINSKEALLVRVKLREKFLHQWRG